MSMEENKAILSRTVEEINKGNHTAFWEVMAPDCIIQDESGKIFKKQEYRQWLEGIMNVFPDYNLVIEDLLADGDRVVVRYTERGTMKGNFMGVEATGKKFMIPAIEIWRFSDGKLIELWMARDLLTQSIQTGLIPPWEEG